MVRDLTAMDIATASLLDEGTAAAEAMAMFHRLQAKRAGTGESLFLVGHGCYPQTLDVLRGRAEPLDIRVEVVDPSALSDELLSRAFGLLLQYPDDRGAIADLRPAIERAHASGVLVAVATDLLALTLITPPGEMGADAVVGNSQRFGVPLGCGGPHAAFLATREAYVRQAPGRIIGLSIDARGHQAYRMALQTREQHIRREKATSNICTAQALLANIAAMYAVYHGPAGLRAIASRVRETAGAVERALTSLGYRQTNGAYFDTIWIEGADTAAVRRLAEARGINFRYDGNRRSGSPSTRRSPTATPRTSWRCSRRRKARPRRRSRSRPARLRPSRTRSEADIRVPDASGLQHPSLRDADDAVHPLARAQGRGAGHVDDSARLVHDEAQRGLGDDPGVVAGVRGHPPVRAGGADRGLRADLRRARDGALPHHGFCRRLAAAEFGRAGRVRGPDDDSRLPSRSRRSRVARSSSSRPPRTGRIPRVRPWRGCKVVVVACDADGNVDLADLRAKAQKHRDELAALMVTYPSTHGVFEEGIREICAIVHEHGGQVYMDGANMNAQVGLTSPAAIGADVCHLNLHKTFAIPHGGGGPGMGPIAVATHLAPYLPGHPVVPVGGDKAIAAVSAAPWGSASILIISYGYIRMLGASGMTDATRVAILNANYIKARLAGHYDELFTNHNGRVAHEMIFDLRPFKHGSGPSVDEQDVAKRLMDYGFHAPTVSFPVPGTMMIEPTESESKAELDRFCEALISIRREIQDVIDGKVDARDNVLKNAPHTAAEVSSDAWSHPYTREQAAYPAPFVRANKFWPAVSRIDNPYGDRNLVCACPPIETYVEEEVGGRK